MPISSSIKSQQPSSSQADFHPLWTMTTAQAIATVMDTGITPSITETRDLGETTSLSPMEGKAGSKLNFCQVLEKQHMSVLNDKKIEIAFINPTQTYSHSPPPGFGHNCIKYRDYSLSEQLTLPHGLLWLSPGSPPHTTPGYLKRGHQLLFPPRSNLSLKVQHSAKHRWPLRQIQWCQKGDRPPPISESCYPQSHGKSR